MSPLSTGYSKHNRSLAAGAGGPDCSKSSQVTVLPPCRLHSVRLHLPPGSLQQQADGRCPACRLRSPKYVRSRAKGDLVDDVIDVLSLRTVQHSVVGSVEKRGIR